jgi:hypothetical protein
MAVFSPLISYYYSSHSTFKNCTIYCMDLLSSFLPYLKAALYHSYTNMSYFSLILCSTFYFSLLCMSFLLCLLLPLDPIYLTYLHVTALILLSCFLRFFRSVQDVSHIHSKFFTLYLISANGISCIPSPYSYYILFTLFHFCILQFSVLFTSYSKSGLLDFSSRYLLCVSV